MVEAKLRVEILENICDRNPFYGSSMHKKVIEESYFNDYDKRSDIAPFGIKATIKVNNKVFDITINRYMFENDVLPNTYHYFFSDGHEVYEVSMGIKDDKILNLNLSRWFEYGYFADGDNCDEIYKIKRFVSFDTYL